MSGRLNADATGLRDTQRASRFVPNFLTQTVILDPSFTPPLNSKHTPRNPSFLLDLQTFEGVWAMGKSFFYSKRKAGGSDPWF